MVIPKFGIFGGIFRSGVIEGSRCRIYPPWGEASSRCVYGRNSALIFGLQGVYDASIMLASLHLPEAQRGGEVR